nr:zinc finger protein 93-like [Lytechinus pictus]
MDYRYVDQQGSQRTASHEDQQSGLPHHQQHLQHLPHFSHQHSLQPPPHQHMHHVSQPVFVAAAPHSSREAYNSRRQSGQDLQSILEVAGLVPVRPPSHHLQHPHQTDQQRQPSDTRPMQLLSDGGQLPRDYSNVPPSLQQHQQPQEDYQRDFGSHLPQTSAINSRQDSGLVDLSDRPQRTNQESQENNDDSDLEPPSILREKQHPGPLPPASSPPKLPQGLVYCFSENDKKKVIGVKAEKTVENRTEFGVFLGALVDEASGCVEESSWELCLLGKILYYVDGKYKRNENWMLHVQCARNAKEQNIEAVQRYGYIHFQSTKMIEPGSELRVYYSDDYAKHAGFKIKLNDLSYKEETDNFQCNECQCFYKSAKRMMRHIKLAHDSEHTGEIRPLFTWEVKKKLTEIRQPSSTHPVRNADNRFICVTCGKDFPTRGRLAAHETFHDFAGGMYVCDHCGEACENAEILTKHILKHQGRPFRCEICSKIFTSKTSLHQHEREVHGWRCTKFSCQTCKQEYEDLAEFKKHQCNDSGKTVQKEDGIKNDKSTAPAKAMDEGGKGKVSDKQVEVSSAFPVDMLGKRFSYFDRPRPYKCRHCGMKFRQYNQRKYHEQEAHEGKGTYQCPQCSQRFATRCNLDTHLKKHNPIRPFQCQLCDRSFASANALSNHQGEHTGAKPYKCTVCDRGFRTQKLMGKHRTRMHGKREKRFACSFCDKRFMERSSWRNHERRHKGIRPHVCLVCGKGFSSKDSMVVHQRIHTGEMPFQCDKCGKSFRNNHNLTAHLLHHTAEGHPDNI